MPAHRRKSMDRGRCAPSCGLAAATANFSPRGAPRRERLLGSPRTGPMLLRTSRLVSSAFGLRAVVVAFRVAEASAQRISEVPVRTRRDKDPPLQCRHLETLSLAL